ncbi:MAG TPA: hypothetical protein PLY87_08535 [Planctomycetaceae bacterium]|jgi:hypothetical protein|nr:hypothetical protein [Planctomycetaceae bacterium]HQZ65107.1 hypothetical protein [Planctomycetaceae bacterium]HRA87408.1 hypothetical protein [Planctomycetaceae bacterium]
MAKFRIPDPSHNWPTHRQLVLPAFAVISTVTIWFWVEAEVFELLLCLLLVVVVTGRTAWSNQASPANLSLLELPFALARDVDTFSRYQSMSESLARISRALDPIYRELALESLDDANRRIHTLADGLLIFEGTETWRLVYERLLRSPGLYQYRSVAWVQSTAYWQDEPGRKSMAVNFELQKSGHVSIERIVIVADELWPLGAVWPSETLRQWIHEQHMRGIRISFVRVSAIASEPELLADFGIYGSRAVGTQELDEHARTVRFRLHFDFSSVAAAEERWNRLAVYSESFASYLDRYEIGG